MNTDNSQTAANTPVNPAPVPSTPAAPVPEMNIPVESKSKLSTLRVGVILLAVLGLAGGAAFLATRQNGGTSSEKTAVETPAPSVTGMDTGLKMAVSDDPAILEQELNDINVDSVDEDLDKITQDSNNL